jgi:hypothetical protein
MAADASLQVAPSRDLPTVGQPTTRHTDGHPTNTRVNTTTPPEPEPEPQPPASEAEEAGSLTEQPETDNVTEAARSVVAGYRALDPVLAGIPRAMNAELTAHTARWLAAGHTAADIRTHILRSLPADGTPIHRPGGLLRYLLAEVPPVRRERRPEAAPATPGPAPESPYVSARLSALRECEGPGHSQATLFRPVGDEVQCRSCSDQGQAG